MTVDKEKIIQDAKDRIVAIAKKMQDSETRVGVGHLRCAVCKLETLEQALSA